MLFKNGKTIKKVVLSKKELNLIISGLLTEIHVMRYLDQSDPVTKKYSKEIKSLLKKLGTYS